MDTVNVWLIVRNGRDKGKVLLQRRASLKEIDGMKIVQSYPYVCQPTVSGEVEPNETVEDAVIRETKKELGAKFANDFFDIWALNEFNTGSYFDKGKQMIVHNFESLISQRQMRMIKLHSGAEELVLVDSKILISEVRVVEDSVARKERIVLFRAQFRALWKLFKLKWDLSHLK